MRSGFLDKRYHVGYARKIREGANAPALKFIHFVFTKVWKGSLEEIYPHRYMVGLVGPYQSIDISEQIVSVAFSKDRELVHRDAFKNCVDQEKLMGVFKRLQQFEQSIYVWCRFNN